MEPASSGLGQARTPAATAQPPPPSSSRPNGASSTSAASKTTTAPQPPRPGASARMAANSSSTSSQPAAAAAPAPAPATAAQGQQGYKPLNVKDALSYLDQVKHQFNRRPQTYNSFLDIMKDFKTQNIDTPGVIDRVSDLFRGHPGLIQGFNTFLPPGYRIDCSFDPTDNGLITVTTPSGVTRRDHNGLVRPVVSSTSAHGQQAANRQASSSATATSAAAAGPSASSSSTPAALSKPGGATTVTPATTATATATAPNTVSPFSGGMTGLTAAGNAAMSAATTAANRAGHAPFGSNTDKISNLSTAPEQPPAAAAAPSSSSSSVPAYGASAGAASAASATPSAAVPAAETTRARQPAEFNHAINFVNKIKNRFNRRPDIYKAFLEILQTYQKEQRAIQDVYAQVTVLFRDAPDLLDEFKEFLPDTSGGHPAPPPAASGLAGNLSNRPVSTPTPPLAGSTAQQGRTGRNSSTTSLFGVNPSGTSQPQPGQAASYLNLGSKDRKGSTTTLEAAASRKPQQSFPPQQQQSQQYQQGQSAQPQPSHLQQQASQGQVQARQPVANSSGVQYDRAEQQLANDTYDESWQQGGPPTVATPAASTTAATTTKKRRTAQGAAAGEKSRAKKGKTTHPPPEGPPQEEPYGGTAAPGYPGYMNGQAPPGALPPPQSALLPPVQPVILPHATRPHGPRNQLQSLVNVDELTLFDRIKKYIDDKSVYHEFLKLLALYTQEIIDMPTLLEKAFLFIGSSDEIFGLFREFVGEQDGFVEGEEWPIDNAPALERERFELYTLESYGPSYRKLPYSESKGLACSGRDALCWSVLNDDWVAFATWASEGSGAHRKNQFEDALACSEQERHWYDYNIESNIRSIALLEPIVARISLMSPEERASFKLKPGLGGQSVSYYERIIRKIYGRDQGAEAIQALYDSPAVAAPIILNRMKQKDEEWKKALREWNRVWREVDAKNYYRSLDHQGLTFKANDKKMTTSKFLVSEIETLRREQRQKRVSASSDPTATPSLRPSHQFEMQIDDFDVVFDVLKLIFSYLDRASTPHSNKERGAIENTLRKMIPLIFNISEKEVEANLAPIIVFGEEAEGEENGVDSDGDESMAGLSDTAASASDTSSTIPNGKKTSKKSLADLRKQLLTGTLQAKAADSADDEEAAVEKNENVEIVPSLAEETWITASPVPWPLPSTKSAASTTTVPINGNASGRSKSHAKKAPESAELAGDASATAFEKKTAEPRYNFYGTQAMYCFMRLFHMLYHRLSTLKEAALALSKNEANVARLSPYAVELGLAVPQPQIDDPAVPRGKNYYEYMLELCEKFFDAEIDSQTFEENLRYMWGIKAFPAFTVDKLCLSMIKHIHSINGDSRGRKLLELLRQERLIEKRTVKHQMIYRHACEEIMGRDDNMYRIEWIPSANALSIQSLSSDELTLDDTVTDAESRWKYHLESFALNQSTEGLAVAVHVPLLPKNRAAIEQAAARVIGKSDLAVRLAYEDFRLSYVKSTEETIFSNAPAELGEKELDALRARRREAWQNWLRSQEPQDEEMAVDGEAAEPTTTDPAQADKSAETIAAESEKLPGGDENEGKPADVVEEATQSKVDATDEAMATRSTPDQQGKTEDNATTEAEAASSKQEDGASAVTNGQHIGVDDKEAADTTAPMETDEPVAQKEGADVPASVA